MNNSILKNKNSCFCFLSDNNVLKYSRACVCLFKIYLKHISTPTYCFLFKKIDSCTQTYYFYSAFRYV